VPSLVPSGPTARALADGVRGRIHRGELGPGDKLPPERQLAEQLGVGRLRIREALALLEEEGYVVARRGATGGRFVTELVVPYNQWMDRLRHDLDELNDIVDFRIAVECEVARLAAARCTKADLTAMNKSIRALERATTPRAYQTADLAFHNALAKASRSTRLVAAVEQARGELFSPVDELWFDGRSDDSARAHQEIADACVRHEGGVAAAAMAGHIEQTRRDIAELLQQKVNG
jgi:GntR family transcriptional regulator, transcriptional repressor for pyruvate dehydrogenase complex